MNICIKIFIKFTKRSKNIGVDSEIYKNNYKIFATFSPQNLDQNELLVGLS